MPVCWASFLIHLVSFVKLRWPLWLCLCWPEKMRISSCGENDVCSDKNINTSYYIQRTRSFHNNDHPHLELRNPTSDSNIKDCPRRGTIGNNSAARCNLHNFLEADG
jgi:hypothetical protein